MPARARERDGRATCAKNLVDFQPKKFANGGVGLRERLLQGVHPGDLRANADPSSLNAIY